MWWQFPQPSPNPVGGGGGGQSWVAWVIQGVNHGWLGTPGGGVHSWMVWVLQGGGVTHGLGNPGGGGVTRGWFGYSRGGVTNGLGTPGGGGHLMDCLGTHVCSQNRGKEVPFWPEEESRDPDLEDSFWENGVIDCLISTRFVDKRGLECSQSFVC